ncbi:hypothetical protein V1525DRAFT_367628, partial [Lipomyces kononenkoae]
MDESFVSPSKRPQRAQRIDYHVLNDGSDDEASPEHRISKKARSAIAPSPGSPPDSSQESELIDDDSAETLSVSSDSGPSRKKTQNQSLWEQFDVSALPGKQWWPKRGKGPLEDREIRCTRSTSTSNMRAHLAKHGIFLNGSEGSNGEDIPNIKQPSITSFFQKQAETNAKKLLEQNLVRWIVADDMAFNTIESPTFQQIFRDLGIALPFNSRMTMARRIDSEFDSCRAHLIDELE